MDKRPARTTEGTGPQVLVRLIGVGQETGDRPYRFEPGLTVGRVLDRVLDDLPSLRAAVTDRDTGAGTGLHLVLNHKSLIPTEEMGRGLQAGDILIVVLPLAGG